MPNVSVRELKNRLAHYLRLSEKGQRITVTRRGKPIAILTPAAGNGGAPAEETEEERIQRKWEALVEKGVVMRLGSKPKIPKKRVRLKGEGPSISEMVLADRGEPLPRQQ